MPVRAVAHGVGISAKRARPWLQAIMGKGVQQAMDALRFQPGPVAEKIAAVLKSAAANAENNHALDPSRLKVVAAYADSGPVLKRFRARARGRVGRIIRHSSHLTVVVDEE